MGRTIFSTPPLFQSKFLCFSVLYLFSALFAAIYSTFSATRCLFRSSPFDPLQVPLFSYPSFYGERKHAVPTSRSSCDSPVFFSDYWTVVDEMQRLWKQNSTDLGAQSLKYLQAMSDSFGGNLTLHNRLSYLGNRDLYPCGFFQQFPIHHSDGMAMERCGGLVVASAIFGDHDKIRQPMGLGSKTLDLVCFFMFVDDATLTRLHLLLLKSSKQRRRIGAWNLVRVSTQSLYGDPAMNGVIPKYLIHRLFPNAKHSIWIDAKMQLVVDPLLLVHALVVKEDVDMAVSRHPLFLHTLEEAMATARWKKWWDVEGLRIQMETYCENGLQPWHSAKPFPTDVPDSAVILRKHSARSNKFSCLVFNELEAFNPRDQLAFAFVRDKMTPEIRMNMFQVQVFERIAVEYRHNLINHNHNKNSVGIKQQQLEVGKCHGYLVKMWGEFDD